MWKAAKLLSSTVLAVAVAVMAGCSREDAGQQQQYLTIKGSDTMVHLVSTWAEAFMEANPGAQLSVTGGGSGTGIAALINGTAEICASSREMNEQEAAQAGSQGRPAVEHVVGMDGIAVIVNPGNPVEALSMEQLAGIYTGDLADWSAVGGPEQPIILLSRESSSGTFIFFQEHVLNKRDYAQSVRLMPATSSIVQSVAEDAWAIGYVGLGYAAEAGDRVKIVPVRATAEAQPVMPSEATVLSGEYSIARPLYLYTAGESTGLARQFIEFCLSPDGQRIVRETGYVPVN